MAATSGSSGIAAGLVSPPAVASGSFSAGEQAYATVVRASTAMIPRIGLSPEIGSNQNNVLRLRSLLPLPDSLGGSDSFGCRLQSLLDRVPLLGHNLLRGRDETRRDLDRRRTKVWIVRDPKRQRLDRPRELVERFPELRRELELEGISDLAFWSHLRS